MTGKSICDKGLSDYGFRDYSPNIARFTSIDPIYDGNNWYAYVNNDPVNWVDPWGLNAQDKKQTAETKKNEYEIGLENKRVRYIEWIPGEGVNASYTYDIYTSITKHSRSYELDVWVIAVSGPHFKYDDTQYYGTVSLNVNGKTQESNILQQPKEDFLIDTLSVMVGETKFQLPNHGDVSIEIKKTGYIYSNPEGKQLSYPSKNITIDIKEK